MFWWLYAAEDFIGLKGGKYAGYVGSNIAGSTCRKDGSDHLVFETKLTSEYLIVQVLHELPAHSPAPTAAEKLRHAQHALLCRVKAEHLRARRLVCEEFLYGSIIAQPADGMRQAGAKSRAPSASSADPLSRTRTLDLERTYWRLFGLGVGCTRGDLVILIV